MKVVSMLVRGRHGGSVGGEVLCVEKLGISRGRLDVGVLHGGVCVVVSVVLPLAATHSLRCGRATANWVLDSVTALSIGGVDSVRTGTGTEG